MEHIPNNTRTKTISFKATADENIELQQIANEKNISKSELIHDILHAYKHYYDYIGKQSPKEEKLIEELNREKKQNRKFSLALENAEHRIEIEQSLNKKSQKDELRLNKTIFDLKEELKIKNGDLSELLVSKNQLDDLLATDKNMYYSSLGTTILAGISLIFVPVLFRK